MRIARGVLLGATALGLAGIPSTWAQEVETKAQKLTFTGRVHTQWRYTSKDGEPSNEFVMRRVRPAIKLKINDWVDGIAEVDFGEGKVAVTDAYFKLEPTKNFELLLGQTKRRFDLFELTSSTQMLMIERDGRTRGVPVVSLTGLTENLQFSNRDIGMFVHLQGAGERVGVDAAVTNGAGANKAAELGEKAFQGRVTVSPLEDFDLALSAGASLHPFAQTSPAHFDSTKYAPAFEFSGELGNWKSGPHVQAGFVFGDNWTRYSLAKDESPSFWAVQGIAAYRYALQDNPWCEAVEPVCRVSYADPNGDLKAGDAGVTSDDLAGLLLTPGINVYLAHRNRLSVNLDIFSTEAKDNAATRDVDESKTEFGLKAQSWLYW